MRNWQKLGRELLGETCMPLNIRMYLGSFEVTLLG